MSLKLVSAVLFVQDIAKARRFYEGLLDQKVDLDHGVNVSYKSGFSIWQTDHAYSVIFGKQLDSSDQEKSKHSCELYFESENLDEIHQRMLDEKVEFVHPLVEQPWGQRVIRFYDRDGHIVEIGEPMECVVRRFLAQGLSVEETSASSSMPVEFVLKVSKELQG